MQSGIDDGALVNVRPTEQPLASTNRTQTIFFMCSWWCRLQELNPRPTVYKTAALPLS
jgi:hypothetical protein